MYNLMLLKCKTLYALKFALVSKMEAMHHLAIENMKSLKVKIYSLRTSFFWLLGVFPPVIKSFTSHQNVSHETVGGFLQNTITS